MIEHYETYCQGQYDKKAAASWIQQYDEYKKFAPYFYKYVVAKIASKRIAGNTYEVDEWWDSLNCGQQLKMLNL